MKKIIIKSQNGSCETIEYREINDVKKLLKNYNIEIGKHTKLPQSLTIGYNSKIGVGCSISDVIIGNNVVIGDEVNIESGSIIGNNVVIQMGVIIKDNVEIKNNNVVGEEAIIESNTVIEDTFYIKTDLSNVTYCGNGKISIGCQLYDVDFWIKHYSKVAAKFNYTPAQIEECLNHIQKIKQSI